MMIVQLHVSFDLVCRHSFSVMVCWRAYPFLCKITDASFVAVTQIVDHEVDFAAKNLWCSD